MDWSEDFIGSGYALTNTVQLSVLEQYFFGQNILSFVIPIKSTTVLYNKPKLW